MYKGSSLLIPAAFQLYAADVREWGRRAKGALH